MERVAWKPGNLLYPLPAVLVSCEDEAGRPNIMTAAWTGTVNSDPAMTYVSIRPERYSHEIITKTRCFAINLTTRALVKATDYCGVVSGRNVDKFKAQHLSAVRASKIQAPLIGESPVALECTVRDILHLGSHDMFLADIVCVSVDGSYLDEQGRFHLEAADLIAYSHGSYYALGKKLGSFGYSVRKPARRRKGE